jgi:hypothetical protein
MPAARIAVEKIFAGLLIAFVLPAAARAQHACDDLGEAGWRTVVTEETVNVADSAPLQAGGDWFVTRTTTILPLCNYINAAGNYSLRSYSLEPENKTERVTICRGGTPVAPYAGSCPPK